MARELISGSKVYAVLIGEFRRLKPAACTQCHIPLPFWGPAPGSGETVYWYMPTAIPCAHRCHQVIAQIWARFTTDYEIASPKRTPRLD